MSKTSPYSFKYDDLPVRSKEFHKGNAGWSLIIGGSENMPGAGLLASKACLYAGSGKVTLMTSTKNFQGVLSNTPEVMLQDYLSKDNTAHQYNVIAYGMGVDDSFLTKFQSLTLINPDAQYIVDGTGFEHLLKLTTIPKNLVLTPHPKEAAMLLGCKVEDVMLDRIEAVKELCMKFKATVILKGHKSLVGSYSIDEISEIQHGNPSMASAGVGDTLSGIIASLIAQGLSRSHATVVGAGWHGYIADILVKRKKRIVTASDIINGLGSYEY